MTTTPLRDALHAQPFKPFAFRLADGRSLPVEHPEFCAYVPGGRTAIVLRSDEGYDLVDLLLVVSLEFGATATPKGTRGKASR